MKRYTHHPGSETGCDEADGLDRIADAIHQRVSGVGCLSLESIGTRAFLALLNAHGLENGRHCLFPGGIEGARVACTFPISMRQANRVTDRVEFILAFSDARLHLSLVLRAPLSGGALRSPSTSSHRDQ